MATRKSEPAAGNAGTGAIEEEVKVKRPGGGFVAVRITIASAPKVGPGPGPKKDEMLLIRRIGEEQVLTILAGREARRHLQRQEAVLGELELVDDLRPQQRERVAEGRELEAGPQLLGDRCAADQVPSLEDEGPQPSLRQVGAVYQAVVAATDDDRVVSVCAHRSITLILRGGL